MLIAVSNIYNEVRYIYISEVKRMAVSSEVNLDAKGLPRGIAQGQGGGDVETSNRSMHNHFMICLFCNS